MCTFALSEVLPLVQYLSEFELLSQPIVPAAGIPPGGSVPFVLQGYFCLISRLVDSNVGDLNVELTFFPTPAFPAATGNIATDPLIADFQDETGATQLNLSFSNSITVPIGSGKTVLVGLQPNFANTAILGAAGQFGVRGYVTIDTASSPVAGGMYQLAVTPQIRAVFAPLDPAKPSVDLSHAESIAYCLPSGNQVILTLTKDKETKEKEATKDSKDSKDVKDAKERIKDKDRTKEGVKDKDAQKEGIVERPPVQLAGDPQNVEASLSERLAALEALVGSGQTFIPAAQRPPVG